MPSRNTRRRTITLDGDLDEAVQELVAEGVADNVSRFVAEAVRYYLAELERQRLAEAAQQLDADHEAELAARAAGSPSRSGADAASKWQRLS